MRQALLRGFQCALLLALCGCTKWHYWVSGEPEALKWRAPILGWMAMDNFSIARFKPGTTEDAVADSSILSMAFAMRSALEMQGYDYVSNPDSADFIVVVHGWNNSHGGLEWSAKDTSLTLNETEPVQLSSYRTENRPTDPYVGYVLPRATSTPKAFIVVFNRATHKPLLRWLEVGTVRETRFEVGEQHFMMDFVSSLNSSSKHNFPRNLGSGQLGARVKLWTPDGVNYWPRLTYLLDRSPIYCSLAEQGDLILSVNGRPLKNLPITEVYAALAGQAGEIKTLKFWRYWGETFEQSIVLARR